MRPVALLAGHGQVHQGISNAVLCGYDVGSFTVQTIAVKRPDLARSLVIAPPTMGVGRRILEEEAVNAFLHAILYKTTLVEDLIDGKPGCRPRRTEGEPAELVGSRLQGRGRTTGPSDREPLCPRCVRGRRHVVPVPGREPITYYANEKKPDPADRFSKPITMLWPDKDPLFPQKWSDNLSDFYSNYTLHFMKNVGHFSPLEAPHVWAEHILEHVREARQK